VADGVWVEVPLDAFMQVNGAVNRALVSHVVRGLAQRGAGEFADLFMGAGNFALPLLAAGARGRGAERHAGAVAAARRVARARGLDGEGFSAGDALPIAERWLAEGVRFDAVLCDPPRAGLGALAGAVARLTRRWLVLCSCRPETLGADVRRLCGEGFAVDAVSLFDMFPQTRHVEAVVWLDRH
jgi:23S rRNA (uracil1939-C5)-methyltransferase